MAGDERGGTSTVGGILETHQVYSVSHPAYKNFSEAVAAELSVLAAREAVRRASARQLVLPFYLTSDQKAELAELYPEFAVVVLPMTVPVHSTWVAARAAANEWVCANVVKYGLRVVHFGGSVMANLIARRDQFHVEVSLVDAVAVHEAYSDRISTGRLFEETGTLARDCHVDLSRKEYDRYLAGEAYSLCTEPSKCTHQADALCVDLTAVEMSPGQVAMAMAQHGARVAMGFFIYEPAMLVQSRGELGDSGVYFDKTPHAVHFRYTEGRSGVPSYSRVVWSRWCSSHSFSIDAERNEWYHLELMKNRGSLMFFRMVRVPKPVGPAKFVHALDLSDRDEYTLVRSWKLKRGLSSDPTRASEWEPNNFLMRSRVVNRAYTFAMQLTPANFSRHAIKKQVRVVNNRWVVQGSVVSVAPALEPQQIEDFTTAVFVRAFVDRYESSRLSAEMMNALMKAAGFHSMTTAQKLVAATGAVLKWLLYRSVGVVDDEVRSFADAIAVTLDPLSPPTTRVAWGKAPEYVTLTTANSRWHSVFEAHAEKYYALSDAELGVELQPDAPGGVVAKFLSMFAVRTHRKVLSSGGERPAKDLESVMRVVTDACDTSLAADSEVLRDFASNVARVNEVDAAGSDRHVLTMEVAERRAVETVQKFRDGKVMDPVAVLNQLYLEVLGPVARADIKYDTFSLSLDPQDRTLAAPYLRMPVYFGLPPSPRWYYESNLLALNVPKRQNVAQELLSAVAARNLTAPAISVPQDEQAVIRDVWATFLDTACVPDAREKLLRYQSDPVALEEGALKDWASKAKPDVVERLVKEMEEQSSSLGDKSIREYLVMLKADAKPTMSDKPVRNLTAPQVIVYHDKLLSALYSSMLRVLVRRFLSLLKPEYHVNLLKDTKDVAEFLTSVHPYDKDGLQFMENDFSQYDKSQAEFAFMLEEHVFSQLGLNKEMLDAWFVGHAECSLRSVALGLSLHVMYQRKSGDASTAFGNVVINITSVTYAYRGSKVVWAVFMGDDSIVCVVAMTVDHDAVRVLAEVFNLTAKFYITDAPYFASNFIIIDSQRSHVRMVPDVVKRIERLSMGVSAEEPQWEERWVSFKDAMEPFSDPAVCTHLTMRVPLRYAVGEGFVAGAAEAFGPLARDFELFRGLWQKEAKLLQA